VIARGSVALAGLLLARAAGAGDAGGQAWPPAWSSASGARVALTGFVQFDARAFPGWEVAGAEPEARAEATEVRRGRLGAEGEWGRFEFEVEADLADEDEAVKDAWLGWRFGRGLRLRAGRLKPPVTREWTTGSRRLDFLERALPVRALAPGRDWGGLAIARLAAFEFEVGAFAGDGAADRSRAEATLAGRIAWRGPRDLELGASGSVGDVRADPPATAEPRPRGIAGDAPSGFRFSEPRFVEGRRRRLGLDAGAALGAFALAAEGVWLREERRGQGPLGDDLPAEVARGFAASALWRPLHEVSAKGRRRPARTVELGLRFERLRFDDAGPDAGFAGAGNRARNVRPAGAEAWTAGASWWPRPWVRLVANLVLERYDDALRAPEPGRAGNYPTLAARLQLALP
jgi:phosphate-selective porin